MSDSLRGDSYVCAAHNIVLRGTVQGDDQKVEPRYVAGEYIRDNPN